MTLRYLLADDVESPSNMGEFCPSGILPEPRPMIRLRARSTAATAVSDKLKEDSAPGPKISGPDMARGRGIFLVAMIAIVALLCFVIWRWSRSQISENSI